MDLIHKFLNNIVAPIALIILLIFLPPYLLFKFLTSYIRSIFSENLTGKVVLITGASSGIVEELAYQYAMKGACLALVARREIYLRQVASWASLIGSPDVIVIRGDVSKVEDCKRFVDETVKHFGRLDHLVTNAGVASVCLFEDSTDVTKLAPAMNINFWGSIYSTYFAKGHLKNSKGKIIVIAASAAWLPAPRLSFYNASKAALISLYETLRIEFGTDIGITIVNPGLIVSQMTQGKFLTKNGKVDMYGETKDVQISLLPIESVEACGKAIVKSACRGDKYLTEPTWVSVTILLKVFCPEIIEWCHRLLLMIGPESSQMEEPSKILDLVKGIKRHTYPGIFMFPELKAGHDCRRFRKYRR